MTLPLYLAFRTGGDGAIGSLVRLRTASRYSHVEFVPWWSPYHRWATCWSASWKDGGVRMKAIQLHRDRWHLVALPYRLTESIYQKYNSLSDTENGKPYDLLGAMTWGTPLRFQRKDKWFCSELLAHMLGLDRPWTYSPQKLFEAVTSEGFGGELQEHQEMTTQSRPALLATTPSFAG